MITAARIVVTQVASLSSFDLEYGPNQSGGSVMAKKRKKAKSKSAMRGSKKKAAPRRRRAVTAKKRSAPKKKMSAAKPKRKAAQRRSQPAARRAPAAAPMPARDLEMMENLELPIDESSGPRPKHHGPRTKDLLSQYRHVLTREPCSEQQAKYF
jgi:hypothetical protein